MSKGLIINADVWDLIDELNSDECRELLTCLSQYCLGKDVQESSRFVRVIYQRITLENERIAKLSAKRAEAGRAGGSKSKQNEAKVSKVKQTQANASKLKQTEANLSKTKQNSFEEREGQEESSKEEKVEKEDIYFNKPIINNTPSSTNNRFNPPTVDDIKRYATEKGYKGFNAEQFWNFYESKNWMVGKNKMTNWHSAVSGWALRDKEKVIESAKPITDYKSQLQKYDYATLLRK